MIQSKVTSKLTHISDKKYHISLEIPSDIVDETFKFFYNKAQAKSTIRGFRPGKAPLNMISKIYQQEVRYDVFDHLANKFVNETIQSHQLKLIKQLNMQIEQFSEGTSLKFFVELEAQKDISIESVDNLLRSIHKLSVMKEKFEMSKIDKMFEHEMNRKKETLSIRTPINEIRKINHGEYSIIDCKYFHNDNLIESLNDLVFMAFNIDLATSMGITKDSLDEIKKDINNTKKTILIPSFLTVDKMIASFFNEYFNEALKHSLMDMEPGQTKKIPVIYPSDHIAYSQTPSILQIHLKQICNITLPQIDDEFAKKNGFSSVQDMNTKLKQNYIDLEKQRIEEKLEIGILEELVKYNPVHIPESYISDQIEYMVQEARKRMLNKNQEIHIINKQIEEWKKQGRFKNDAIYSISEAILVQKLAKIWDLFEPTKKEFKKILMTNKRLQEIIKKDQENIMHPILFGMIRKVVVQRITLEANIKES